MSFNPNGEIQRRWRSLPDDSPRDQWFAALRDAIQESYLSEPQNPYRGSGRSSGADRWFETRKLLAEGIDGSGDYMDVGCANGLLLESLQTWVADRGHRLVPHGIDLVPELIAVAQERHPDFRENFRVANAFDWRPARRYDWVRTNIEFVQPRDRATTLLRLLRAAVAPGGFLVLCHYRERAERSEDLVAFARGLGLDVERAGSAPGVDVVWIQA